MSLEIIRLLFDAGLFILIWIVQLVIYPGFSFYNRDNLMRWHERYTSRITLVVMPLMLGQLAIVGLQLWSDLNGYTVASAFVVLLLWLSTFLKFIPLHQRIADGDFDKEVLNDLVRFNWGRTVLWTALFVLSVVEMIGFENKL